MLISEATLGAAKTCGGCDAPAEIQMNGYGGPDERVAWCAQCALQLARKILEDLCELHTKGGRHG